MKKRLLWTTTALLTTTLGTPSVQAAVEHSSPQPGHRVSAWQGKSTKSHPTHQKGNISQPQSSPGGLAANSVPLARVQPHELQGRMAATLIVRNVPVLTFIASTPLSAISQASGSDRFQLLNEPIMRATSLAAQINQMSLNNVDGNQIYAVWEGESKSTKSSKSAAKIEAKNSPAGIGRYVIKVQDEELVEINAFTRLPDTISNPAKDALQATNRLRALLGNAAPLQEISGQKISLPKDRFLGEFSFGNLRVRYSYAGLASWYSFRENGIQTASGEPYNENDLTAAHKQLPFGTKVQVTNLQNGRSVVVRITDRGPYIQGREIDLSTAAAGVIGMINSGVVPVQLDILAEGN